MSQIINIRMESDLSEWTSETDTGDRIVWASAAALAGSSGGMSASPNADATARYAQKTVTTNTSGIVRARVYYKRNTLRSNVNAEQFYWLMFLNSSNAGFGGLKWRYIESGTQYQITAYVTKDDLIESQPSFVTIDDNEHYIEILIVRSTGSDTNDGYMNWSIDGVAQTSITGVDLYDARFTNFSSIRVGMVAGIDANTTGTFYIDEIVVNDDGSPIGPFTLSSTGTLTSTLSTLTSSSFSSSAVVGTLTSTLGTLTLSSNGYVFNVDYLRPVSDTVVGNWTTDTGATTGLYNAINETSPDDNDYIRSEVSPTGSSTAFALDVGGDAGLSVGHIMKYRYGKIITGAGETVNLTVQLRQDYVDEGNQGTLIAEWQHSNISETLVTAEQALTTAQADSITNYSSLFARLIADVS